MAELWTPEADAALLNLLERYKPCGAQRPWAIASLKSALKIALPASTFSCEAVAQRVNDYYNYDSAAMDDIRQALEKSLRTPGSFKLPRRIWLAERDMSKKEAAPDLESVVSEAVTPEPAGGAEPSPASEDVGDDRKRKRRSTSPSKRSGGTGSAAVKQEVEGARRRQQRAEEVYRSVKAKTGRYQSVGELAYGALRDLGGAAPFEQLASHIETKDVWASLERKQALRIEKDAKAAGEELRAQLRQALGHSSLFAQRSDGQYALREEAEAEGGGPL